MLTTAGEGGTTMTVVGQQRVCQDCTSDNLSVERAEQRLSELRLQFEADWAPGGDRDRSAEALENLWAADHRERAQSAVHEAASPWDLPASCSVAKLDKADPAAVSLPGYLLGNTKWMGACVTVAKEGFASGRHYFEVKVGGKLSVASGIGLVRKPLLKKGHSFIGQSKGAGWCVTGDRNINEAQKKEAYLWADGERADPGRGSRSFTGPRVKSFTKRRTVGILFDRDTLTVAYYLNGELQTLDLFGGPSAFSGVEKEELLYPAVCHDGSTEGSGFSLVVGLPLPNKA
jgi:hypothetical protein